MGEIIYSICIGGCLVLAGVILIVATTREKNKILRERDKK